MNPEEAKHIELIERYLDRTLAVEEISEVEDKIRHNPDFARLVAQHRMAQELIVDRGLLELKQKIKDGNYGNESKGGLPKGFWLLGGLLLLAVAIYTVFNFQNQPTTTVLAPKEVDKVTAAKEPSNVSAPLIQSHALPPKASEVLVKTPYIKPFVKNEKQTDDPASVTLEELPRAITSPSIGEGAQQMELGPQPSSEPIKTHLVKPELKKVEESKTISSELSAPPIQEQDDNEYLFNPALGQVWVFPLGLASSTEIIIFGKNGEIVYKSQINQGQPSSWNGLSNTKAEVPMGSYPFVISDEQGKVIQGYVTIQK